MSCVGLLYRPAAQEPAGSLQAAGSTRFEAVGIAIASCGANTRSKMDLHPFSPAEKLVNRAKAGKWQFVVFGFDTEGEGARDPMRKELIASLSRTLPDDVALLRARTGLRWEDVSGAQAAESSAVQFGTGCLLILANLSRTKEWERSANTAIRSLTRVIHDRTGRKRPPLTRETALVQARLSVESCFPRELGSSHQRLLVMQERLHDDGSWEFGFKLHDRLRRHRFHNSQFLVYVARVSQSQGRAVCTTVRKDVAEPNLSILRRLGLPWGKKDLRTVQEARDTGAV